MFDFYANRKYLDEECKNALNNAVLEKVTDLLDSHETEVAKTWFFIIRMMFSSTHSELQNLRRTITERDRELQNATLKEAMDSTSGSCYFFGQSKLRLTQWLFTPRATNPEKRQNGFVYFLYAPRIPILALFVGDDDGSSDTEIVMVVNWSIKLRTLVMLILGRLEKSPEDYTILHVKDEWEDRRVLEQYSDKSLHELNIHRDDLIIISDASKHKQDNKLTKQVKRKKKKKSDASCKSSQNNRKAGYGSNFKSGSKKQSSRSQIDYSIHVETDRANHSMLLTRVFEEASELFRERRQRLNDLATEKCQPKKKAATPKATPRELESLNYCTFPDLGGKAGNTFFPILIGQDEYLYKSSKATRRAQAKVRCIDLHGCTRDEALHKLNSSLPLWMDQAMTEFPWTLPVDVIVGGGSQLLSEAVQHWIRENRNVANRFG